jgi:hypothetical protein
MRRRNSVLDNKSNYSDYKNPVQSNKAMNIICAYIKIVHKSCIHLASTEYFAFNTHFVPHSR